MYYGGESTSILFPEANSNQFLARKLQGIFAEPRVKRFPLSLKIVGVSLSNFHALAWTSEGNLYSWGSNKNGVLGLKDNEKAQNRIVSNPTPVMVGLGNNPGIYFALATRSASIVINFRGRIYYWGR